MKKTLLSVMLGFVLVTLSFVMAANVDGVVFNTPIATENISGTFNVSWNNTIGNPDMFLQYREGSCEAGTWSTLIGSFNETIKNFLWDTTARTDGQYCLRIESSGNETISGNFTIDNTAPNVTFIDTPYFVIVNSSIVINATLVDSNWVDNYTIDFGDSTTPKEVDVTDAPSYSLNETYTYNTSGQFTVTITGIDVAGNSAIATNIVTVNSATPDWIIELSTSSMNLFSIPFVPNDTSYSPSASSTNYKNALGGIVGNLDRVWGYTFDTSTNTNSWKYRKTTAGGAWSTAAGQDLDDIVPGHGYIAFMRTDGVLYGNAKIVSNDPESAPVIPSSIKLANDFNLIGVFNNTNTSISNSLSSLKSLEGDAYWHKLYHVNGTEKTGDLVIKEGYWISMKHLPDTATEDYYTYFA
jgi:hypothetical protein